MCRPALDMRSTEVLKCPHMSPADQNPFPRHATRCAQGARSTSGLIALEKQALLCTTGVEEALWVQNSRATSAHVLLFSVENGSVLSVCAVTPIRSLLQVLALQVEGEQQGF